MDKKLYTKNGEWIARDGAVWKTGLAASAAAELGDVTFAEVPAGGRQVAAGEAVCALEAVKAAADFYAPAAGRLSRGNPRLEREPQLVSTHPESEGWIAEFDQVDEAGLATLLDEAAWKVWEAGR